MIITLLIFGIPTTLVSCHRIFYVRKNRFYVSTQDIGFEQRKWLRMQKRFFKFGEVGAIRNMDIPIPTCNQRLQYLCTIKQQTNTNY